MENIRKIKQIVKGMRASDGDGVQLTRIIGSPYLNVLDPFLLLDAFGSDKPQEYIGGFPAHPHRGFETVTYMMAGKMRHKDSAGNEGVIESGGIQWMSAGKGIIHSEMPEQEDGLLAGFQLWVNLPAKYKMMQPNYQEHSSRDIPVESTADGISIKVIAGDTINGTKGIIKNPFVDPIYWDVNLEKGKTLNEVLTKDHNAFVYVIEGSIIVGSEDSDQPNGDHDIYHGDGATDAQTSKKRQGSIRKLDKGQLAVLTQGELVQLSAVSDSRFLLIAGRPLNEPIERAGPFVMNTKAEIQQAFHDYQSGQFG